jgi:hypothetical protein
VNPGQTASATAPAPLIWLDATMHSFAEAAFALPQIAAVKVKPAYETTRVQLLAFGSSEASEASEEAIDNLKSIV